MKTWSELYQAFIRCAALVTTAEANQCCEELASRILEETKKRRKESGEKLTKVFVYVAFIFCDSGVIPSILKIVQWLCPRTLHQNPCQIFHGNISCTSVSAELLLLTLTCSLHRVAQRREGECGEKKEGGK